eukprot:3518716-Amphidinium_carterae.2
MLKSRSDRGGYRVHKLAAMKIECATAEGVTNVTLREVMAVVHLVERLKAHPPFAPHTLPIRTLKFRTTYHPQ